MNETIWQDQSKQEIEELQKENRKLKYDLSLLRQQLGLSYSSSNLWCDQEETAGDLKFF